MISCGRSGWLAQNLAMLLDIPPYRRSHFERRLAECSILCLPFSLSSRCFVMRCQTERPWIAWTGTPTASPKCYANDQARDALKMGRDWPVMPTHIRYARIGRMSHPDQHGPPDRTPIKVGEVWENPVTGERATILERPWDNPAGRATAELTALVGARVVGEHRHPALVEQFTVLEGELTVKRNKETNILNQGETAVICPGVWHDWWNASTRDARVRVEITPGERFVHMIETFYGLARLGHTDRKGMPYPLQLALSAQEFSDVIVFRSPPLVVQRAIFGALAPIARWRGYRPTYPQLSRIVLATRT